MFKDTIIANSNDLMNPTVGIYDNANIISNLNSKYYTSGFNEIKNSVIIADIPTIFTIISAEVCGPKLVRIKYKVANPQLNTLFKNGTIYINSGIFGAYDALTNFYWRNEIIIEVESEECIAKIQPEMKFADIIQWEKKLTVEEIVNTSKESSNSIRRRLQYCISDGS